MRKLQLFCISFKCLNESVVGWEQAQEDIEHLKQVLLTEQFMQCLPVKLHRWVIERSPETMSDSACFAAEFSILYKPLKVEKFGGSNTQGNSFGNRNSD